LEGVAVKLVVHAPILILPCRAAMAALPASVGSGVKQVKQVKHFPI